MIVDDVTVIKHLILHHGIQRRGRRVDLASGVHGDNALNGGTQAQDFYNAKFLLQKFQPYIPQAVLNKSM